MRTIDKIKSKHKNYENIRQWLRYRYGIVRSIRLAQHQHHVESRTAHKHNKPTKFNL